MTNTNDIDALLRLWSESARSDHRRYHRALTALIAERDEYKARCKAQHEVMTDMVAERDALKQRVEVLEFQEFTLPSDPFRDADRDLRERLVCAALTGVCADPNMNDPDIARFAGDIADAAVAIADATLAAMRKGEA